MRKISKLIIFTMVLVFLVGCGQKKQTSQTSTSNNRVSQVTTSEKNERTKITVNINGTKLKAHLNNSSAAKAFAKELPTNLKFRDFMDMPEKVADLNHSLTTKGMPKGHKGTKGAIGYWSPQQRIVFYYGTEDYYEGIHIIGSFDSDNYKDVVKNMGNDVNVTISKD